MNYKKDLRIEFLYPSCEPGKYHCGWVKKSKKINLSLTPNYFIKAEKFTIKEFQNVNDNEGKTTSWKFLTLLFESQLQNAIRFHNGKWGILQPSDVLL